MSALLQPSRSAARAAGSWRRRHAVAILISVGLVGLVCAGVVVAGPPRADGDLATLSGLLITWPVIRLLDRALAAPDWRFSAALAISTALLIAAWIGLDWEPAHSPAVLAGWCLLALAPRSGESPRWQRQAALQERIEEQRVREERIRREYPEEFRPTPWAKAD
jgi:hypothetical protein